MVAFTATANLASEKVMQAIGMRRERNDFDHPDLPEGHPLRRHLLYRITRAQWLDTLRG